MFQDAEGRRSAEPQHRFLTWGWGVPGTVHGPRTALAKYGTLSLKEVMAPAIKLARDGYVLEQGDVNILNDSAQDFARHPNVAAIFLNHGKPYMAGERLVQKELAQTLERSPMAAPTRSTRAPSPAPW